MRQGKVVIAKTDADGVGRELGTKYGVTGFPSKSDDSHRLFYLQHTTSWIHTKVVLKMQADQNSFEVVPGRLYRGAGLYWWS